jgi:hypothetical protein
VLEPRDDGSERHHRGRQQLGADQRVDQGALAALELAGHDEVEGVLAHFGAQRGQRCAGNAVDAGRFVEQRRQRRRRVA